MAVLLRPFRGKDRGAGSVLKSITEADLGGLQHPDTGPDLVSANAVVLEMVANYRNFSEVDVSMWALS
jgi:hypothetical protein